MSEPVTPPPPEAVVTQMIFGKWVAMLAGAEWRLTRVVPAASAASVIEGEAV